MPATFAPDWMIEAGRAGLAGDGDGAAAVLLGVGHGLAQPGVVAAEAAAAHAAAGAGRRAGAGAAERPPVPAGGAARPRAGAGGSAEAAAPAAASGRGRRRSRPAPARPPGTCPLVACPSVCTAQLAGASSSSPSAAARTARAQRPADGDEGHGRHRAADEQDGGQPRELTGELVQHEQLGRHPGGQRQRPRRCRRHDGRERNQPDPGADEHRREGRQLRDVVGMEDPLGEAEGDGGREEHPAGGDQPAGAGVRAPQARDHRQGDDRDERRSRAASRPARRAPR